jgi:hypothetical protein
METSRRRSEMIGSPSSEKAESGDGLGAEQEKAWESGSQTRCRGEYEPAVRVSVAFWFALIGRVVSCRSGSGTSG